MKFTWDAKKYYLNSKFQYDHAHEVLKYYRFKGDENVLDIGCGDGKITKDVASLIPHGKILGIDSSEAMISFAKTEFQDLNINFEICKAENITSHSQFDIIVSFACLHWVEDQLKVLNNIRNALKTNGKAIITLYPKHRLIWGAIQEATEMSEWAVYFNNYKNAHISYDLDSYNHFIKTAGLKKITLNQSTTIAQFKDVEAANFLKSWLPHTEQVPIHLCSRFIMDIIDQYINKTDKNNSSFIAIPFERLDAFLSR